MNLSLIVQKTIKRFIGRVISRFIKPKKPPLAEPKIPPAPTIISQPEPRQFQPPPSPQNPMVFLLTSLGKRVIGKAIKTGSKEIAIAKFISGLTKPEKVVLPQAVSQPEPSRPQPAPPPPPHSENLMVSVVASLGKMAIRKTIETGSKKIAVGRLIGGIAGRAAGGLAGAATTTSGLLSGLTAASLPAIVPVVAVIGAVLGVVLITLITVMAVGGAFQNGRGGQIPNLGNPIVAQAPSPTSQLGETVIWTLNQCGITAINKSTWPETENCLRSSPLPNKETIIAQFHFSVFEVGPGLQCVGFVRGVMAALSKDPGSNRDAKDYLNPPPPSGYQSINTNMPMVQKGDLVIMRGTQFGHIALVIERTGDLIKVAQAWGTANGLLQITEINFIYFDGFLRPQ